MVFCRIVSLTSIVVHTFIHRDKHELCAQNFIWYPTTTIAVFVVMLALHIALAVVSGSGGVFEKKARQNLPTLCYIRTSKYNRRAYQRHQRQMLF